MDAKSLSEIEASIELLDLEDQGRLFLNGNVPAPCLRIPDLRWLGNVAAT